MDFSPRMRFSHCPNPCWYVLIPSVSSTSPRSILTSYQFIFRFEIGDAYLGAISRFTSNAFEYGDALLPRSEGEEEEGETSPQIESNQPYLNLATFRMVVLADEVLESFFETDLSASFRLEPVPLMELPPSNSGFLGGLWSNIASDDNKKLFNKFSDELGKTIGRHQIIHRPSIGRYTSVEEPRARESLLMPSMRRSSSKSSLSPSTTSTVVASESTISIPSSGAKALSVDTQGTSDVDGAAQLSPMPPMALVEAANAALMERTPFAIDDAKDDEDDEDEEEENEEDDGVMDEVCQLLSCDDVLAY